MAAYGASRGELNRDGNQGSAMDDYLATLDQRFPSVSSLRIKKRSFHPALWKYLCLCYWAIVQQGSISANIIKQRQYASTYVHIDAHMVTVICSGNTESERKWKASENDH